MSAIVGGPGASVDYRHLGRPPSAVESAIRLGIGHYACVLRTAVWLGAIGAAVITVVLVVLPIRASTGAGSVRCGYVWESPYAGEGLGDLCREASADRRIQLGVVLVMGIAFAGAVVVIRRTTTSG